MRFFLRNRDRRVRQGLIAAIENSGVDYDWELRDDTSLIKSGRLDSLGLFNVVLFVEKELGPSVDIASVDLARDWDTISDILRFIAKQRTQSKRSREKARPH